MTIVELVLAVHAQLEARGIAHAFGGALALAYIIDPRGTVDVDVNVFAPLEDIDDALGSLREIGFVPERPRDEWMPSAGIRLRTDDHTFPIDVFPSLDQERYTTIAQRVTPQKFGPDQERLPFLSPEDLALFKLSFGRDKDWVDLRKIADARPEIDVHYIEDQLVGLRGPTMHPRLARFRRVLGGTG